MYTSTELKETDQEQQLEEAIDEIGKDVAKYVPSKVVGMLFNLLLVPLYTNLLIPEQYGLYWISISVLSFFCIIFSDWVGLSGLRFFKEHDKTGNIKSYFSTLLFLLVTNLGLLYLSAFVFFKPVSEWFKIPSDLLYLVLLLIIPVAFRALLFQILRAQIKPLTYTVSVIINQFLTIGIAVYLLLNTNIGVKAIILGMAVSIVAIDLVMLSLSKMGKNLSLKNIKFDILTKFYKYGLPIAVSSMAVWIFTQSNKFVLQWFKGSAYNGLYGVGFNLTYSAMMPLFAMIILAAVPRIISKYEQGMDIRPIVKKLTGYFFILFTPLLLIFCLCPKDLVHLFANNKYEDAYILIPFLAFSAFFYGLAEYTTIQYHLIRKTHLDTIIRFIPGIAQVILNIIFINKYGLITIGVTTCLTNFLYLLFSLLVRIKGLAWQPPYAVIARCALGFAAGICMYFLANAYFAELTAFNFFVKVGLMTLIYLVVIKVLAKGESLA